MIKGGTVYKRTPDTVALIERLPYITRITGKAVYGGCDAWTGGGNYPKKCDRAAEFYYKAGRTEKAHVHSQQLCWGHLFTHAIFAKVYERDRAERAWKRVAK